MGWKGGGEGSQGEGGEGAEVGEYHSQCLGWEGDETSWQPWVRMKTLAPFASFPAGRHLLCLVSQTQVSEKRTQVRLLSLPSPSFP